MLFSKKPKRKIAAVKLDPKVRFQRDSFRKKLTAASNYKRPAPGSVRHTLRQVTTWRRFVSWWTAVVFVVVLTVYVALWSPWLVLSRVVVVGLADDNRIAVTDRVRDFLDTKPWYTFSRRAVLLPTQAITSVVTSSPDVAQVESVRYNWRRGELVITVEPALPRFVVVSGSERYVVYESGQLAPAIAEAEARNLQALSLPSEAVVTLTNQKMLLTPRTAQVLAGLRRDLLDVYTPTQVAWYVEPADFKPTVIVAPPVPLGTATATLPVVPSASVVVPEPVLTPPVVAPLTVPVTAALIEGRITVDGKPGYRLIFDIQRDPTEAVAELRQLLAGLGSDRLSQLAYIDLRVANKAFVCLQTAPCNAVTSKP